MEEPATWPIVQTTSERPKQGRLYLAVHQDGTSVLASRRKSACGIGLGAGSAAAARLIGPDACAFYSKACSIEAGKVLWTPMAYINPGMDIDADIVPPPKGRS